MKISVADEGIYQITYEALKNWGFTDPRKVAVYGYGGTALTDQSFIGKADDLTQTATYHTDDDRLLFYSDGVCRLMVNTLITEGNMCRNYYSDKAFYLLSDCENIEDIPLNEYSPSTYTTLTFHIHSDVIEKEEQNPVNAGVFFHEKELQTGESRTYGFHIRDYVEPGIVENSAYDRGVFRYFAALRSDDMLRFSSSCAQVEAISASVTNDYATTKDKPYLYETCKGVLPFNAGDRDLSDATVSYTVSLSSPASYAAIDRVQLLYPRNSCMHDDASLIMSYPKTHSGQGFIIYDATEATQVWNVTDPMSITAYERTYDDEAQTIKCSFEASYPVTAQTAARIVAFNPAAIFPETVYEGDVPNQDIHGDTTPDMMIITTATLADQARQLAEIHREYQGLEVSVYVHEDIFNEFSSGTPHVMAYRRAAKMFYDRAPGKFKHILLYGPTSFDNRSLTVAPDDRLLSFQTEEQLSAKDPAASYSADVYFAMLNDNFNISNIYAQTSQICVGRIPAACISDATIVNEKIRRHLADLPGTDVYSRVLSTSDDGDKKGHLMNAEEATDAMLDINPDLTIIRIHNGAYTLTNGIATLCQKAIADALRLGVGYFTYSGHGGGTTISMEDMWDSHLSAQTDYPQQGMAVLATCDIFHFDRPVSNLCRDLLLKLDGGCMGIIGSGRSVYMEHNQSANLAWAKAYAAATPGTTYGDIYKNGRNDLLAGGSNYARDVNVLCYNLCGDPAIPVAAPHYRADITSIDGARPVDASPVGVSPLTPITITGTINNSSTGTKVQDFNGQVNLIIYDGPYSVAIRNESGSQATAPTKITIDDKILSRTSAVVTNGEFTATVTLPVPNVAGVSNRIIACAVNTLSGERALGSNNAFVVNGYDAEAAAGTDTSAPKIERLYIDSEDFHDGDTVDGSFTLYATIDPSASDLCLTNSLIGNSPKAFLDGTRDLSGIGSYIKVNAATDKAYLAYPVKNVSDGHHSISLTLTNNAGSSATESVNFFVFNGCVTANVSVRRQVARDEAIIELTHNLPSETEATLVIENADGTPTLYRPDATFPFTWDLRDTDGSDVTDGRYSAYVLLKSGRKYGSTQKTDIVVIR